MTTEEILGKATPRPWTADGCKDGSIPYHQIDGRPPVGDDRFATTVADTLSRHQDITAESDKANAELIVLAVNAYEDLQQSNEALEPLQELSDGAGYDIPIPSVVDAVKHLVGMWESGHFDCGPQDWQFIHERSLIAVNSLEPHLALIEQLVKALGNMECGECGHTLRLHLDQYGCEYERGDREGYEGEPAQAMGPCGCKCAESWLEQERNALTALAAAKAVQP